MIGMNINDQPQDPARCQLQKDSLKEQELEKLWKKLNEQFIKAFATYNLITDGDFILVALSGGKDSLCLLELLARRAKIHHPKFRVDAVHVRMENIHYETSTSYLEHFCQQLGVKFHVMTTRFEVGEVDNQQTAAKNARRQKSPCFLCSWNRRKQIFNLAQQLGCNKIALGHHQDDIIHTTLMNMMFQGRFGTMPAKLEMRKMPLTLIRPLCMMREADIQRYAQLSGYQKQHKQCPYEHDTHRSDIKKLYMYMEQISPDARNSIWRALNTEHKLEEYKAADYDM